MVIAVVSASPPLPTAVVQQFVASARGDAIQPDDVARQVYNAIIHKRPALIARCTKDLLGILSRCSGVDSRPPFKDSRRDW